MHAHSQSTKEEVKPKQTPLYKDHGKTLTDLLTKDFPGTYKFELNTTSENGLKFTTVVEQKTGKPGSDGHAPTHMFGSFQTKVDKTAKYGCSFTGTVDSELLRWEIVLSDLFKNGIKSTFKGSSSMEKLKEIYGDVEYRTNSWNASLAFNFKDDVPKLEGTVVVGKNGTTLGGKLVAVIPEESKEGGLESVSVLGGYNHGPFDFTGTITNKLADGLAPTVALNLLYKHSSQANFGTNVNWDPAKSLSDGVTVAALGEYAFDKDSTVKAKVTTEGTVGLAWKQKLNSNLTLSVGTDLNLIKSQPAKLGASLSFTP